MEIKPPELVDPDFDGLGRLEALTQKAYDLIESGEIKQAQGELCYIKGMLGALKHYFYLKIKE